MVVRNIWSLQVALIINIVLLDDSQTAEAETMETGDQPADVSVIEGDRYVLISP